MKLFALPDSDVGAPQFSVVIPTYNRAFTLVRAVESVLRQTYGDYELIVVDDGSSDATPAVMEEFDDARIQYIRQENRGVSAARNMGAAQTRGQYLTFLDSDDEAMPEWLERFAEALSQPGVGAVFAGYLRQTDGDVQQVLPSNLGPLFRNQKGTLLAGTFALLRAQFMQLGGYVESLVFGENTELVLRLLNQCAPTDWRTVAINAPLIKIYAAPADRSKRHAQAATRLASIEYVLNTHAESMKVAPEVHGYYLAVAGVCAARDAHFSLARRYFRRAIQVHPANWQHWMRLGLATVPRAGELYWNRADKATPGGSA